MNRYEPLAEADFRQENELEVDPLRSIAWPGLDEWERARWRDVAKRG